jgi:hypothetical protein
VNPCCPDASFLQVGHNSQADSASTAKEVVARPAGGAEADFLERHAELCKAFD